MSKKIVALVSLFMVVSLWLSACGAPAPTGISVLNNTPISTNLPFSTQTSIATQTPTNPHLATMACALISTLDYPNYLLEDYPTFGARGLQYGLMRARDELGVIIFTDYSQSDSDNEVNLNAWIEAGCDLVIPIGLSMVDAVAASASANPDQKYAIVDVDYLPQANVRGNAAKIDQATFLAGYLAAGMTRTGKIGTYVDALSPANQVYLDGFYMGMMKYNDVHHTSVELLGWDPETQVALEAGKLLDPEDTSWRGGNGRIIGEQLLDQGVDIIMPVALYEVDASTLQMMSERKTGLLIGVDFDWSRKEPFFCWFCDLDEFVLASVLKNIDGFVYDSVKQIVDGTFTGGSPFYLTLENQGVGLKYGFGWESKIPADLAAEIAGLSAGIISGEIPTVP
jgi:basic membrane protein A